MEKMNNISIFQKCTNGKCESRFNLDEMLFKCKKCGCNLEYEFEGKYNGGVYSNEDQWMNFDLIPLQDQKNIVSLGAGSSKIILLEEARKDLNGANLYIMLDCDKNPTKTFKDREASIIISRCKELRLDNLVFYSTGNTGRSYTHFASQIGLTTFLFMPKQCSYKNTSLIRKNKNNFIIYVDVLYPQVSNYAKKFAQINGLTMIAPMHDRTEAYATIAYEQIQKLPECDYFAQTIASGMGPLGFYKGHKNLVKLGVRKSSDIPKIVCIQSSEMNIMAKAYNSGRKVITNDDLPKIFSEDLYEPTLNSTNPVNNYPDLYRCLKENDGIITDVDINTINDNCKIISYLEAKGIKIQSNIEKSILIGFEGLIKLAKEEKFKQGENILLLGTGRGEDKSNTFIEADAIINPESEDPIKLYKKLIGNI